MDTDLRPHVRYLHHQREALRSLNQGLKDKLAKSAQKGWQNKKKLVGLGENLAGAAVAGVLAGHSQDERGPHILGLPANAVIGGALVATGLTESIGDYSDHALEIGRGFLAEFAGNWGYGVGQQWRETGKFSLFGRTLADAPSPVKGELTPSDMADIVNRGG